MTRDRTVPDKRFFRLDEVAALLDVHRTTVWRMVRAGELLVLSIRPRLTRVSREELLRVLRGHAQ